MLLTSLVAWNWPNGSAEDFWISSMYFCYSLLSPPWTNLNPLNPRTLCAKFVWKWSNDHDSSGEDFEICQWIFTISLLSPLRKGQDPSFEHNINLILISSLQWVKYSYNQRPSIRTPAPGFMKFSIFVDPFLVIIVWFVWSMPRRVEKKIFY